MADPVLVIDCAAQEPQTRPRTAAETQQATTDAQVAASIEQPRVARLSDADSALGQLITLAGGTANVRTKLKAVLAGTDTFTNAQAQRLLAAVALSVLRDRADS